MYISYINFFFLVNSDQCQEPLLSEKQTSHRIMSARARSRTISESTIGNTIMGTTSATSTNMVTVTAMGTGTNANAWMDTVVGVNTTEPADKSAEEDSVEVPIFDEGTTDSGRLPDVVAEIYGVNEDEPLESYLAITIQVFIPFLIAGLGMVGAGLVLDLVQVWTHFFPFVLTFRESSSFIQLKINLVFTFIFIVRRSIMRSKLTIFLSVRSFFLIALGCVWKSERAYHSGASTVGFEREFGNDSRIPPFDSGKSRTYGRAKRTMVHDRWKSRFDSSEFFDSHSIFDFSLFSIRKYCLIVYCLFFSISTSISVSITNLISLSLSLSLSSPFLLTIPSVTLYYY